MRTSDQSERLVGDARAVRLSGADHRRILRLQLAFRLGGLLVLAATSPLIGALRMDRAVVRITLFIVVYIGAEALLRRKTGRIVAEVRAREDGPVRQFRLREPGERRVDPSSTRASSSSRS